MKIVYSRKGFDSSAGGFPSPIVDGRPISFPIPTKQPTNCRFDDLSDPLPKLVVDLTKGKIESSRPCHLDPNISFGARHSRPIGWRGALGQIGSSQSHLANNHVGVGDLFLFWGLFCDVALRSGKWEYVGKPHHLIFGWMEIVDVCRPGANGSKILAEFPWLRDHPHARDGWGIDGTANNNTIYLAPEASTFLPGHNGPGYGMLAQGFQLTSDLASKKSIWKVPEWLHPEAGGCGMTYHPDTRWLPGLLLQTAGRGQEFVADIGQRQDALAWVSRLLAEAA